MSQPGEGSLQEHSDQSVEADHIETIDLDTLPPCWVAPRKRLLQLGCMVLLISITLVGFWYYLTPTPKMPTATHVVSGQALIESNVSSGTVTLNGKKLAGAPPLLATLSQGVNHLTIEASPFRSVSCQIEWPPTFRQDTCKGPDGGSPFNLGNPPTTYMFQGKAIIPKVVIALPLLLEHLPASLQNDALAAVTQALNKAASALQSVVPAGQYFAAALDAHGLPIARLATSSLQAFPLVSQATSPGAINGCAVALCPNMLDSLPAVAQSVASPLWSVVVQIAVGWRFTTAAGDQVSEIVAFSTVSFLPLVLSYTSTTGWIGPATPQPNLVNGIISALCDAGQGVLAIAASTLPITVSGVERRSAAGCKLGIDLRPSDVTPTPGKNTPTLPAHGEYLWRFGVLLAIDENSHTLLPNVPLAPSAEVAAVGG
jgi:hypothetical protein